MNLFILDTCPTTAAQLQCNKHVVKMIVETAQLLSTAHRLLDGNEYIELVKGRRLRRWRLSDKREDRLYKATHWNHPSAIWTRESDGNYNWAVKHLRALLCEYTRRYNKVHKCEEIYKTLLTLPQGIKSADQTPFNVCISEELYPGIEVGDPVESYRRYYKAKKDSGAVAMHWPEGETPNFIIN